MNDAGAGGALRTDSIQRLSSRYHPQVTENRAAAGLIGLAQVMAHCGGSPLQTLRYINGAIASAPEDPEPYSVLADLWTEQRTDVAELLR
jgi:hypothetical protein